MRTTVNIDDEVLAAAKAKARMSGEKLGEVLSHWAKVGMTGGVSTPQPNKSKLPCFQVSAKAMIISSDRCSELLDEEA